ncbi:MAG: mechanosensitive ion channel [Thermoplasmata archaeon]
MPTAPSPTALSPPPIGSGRLVLYSIGILLLFVVIGVLLYDGVVRISGIPLSATTLLKLVVVAALGVAAIVVTNLLLRRTIGRIWGPRRAGQVSAIFRIAAYCVLALVLLATAGISALALLAGGTFAGLVLGLASQDILSSLFAGIVILAVQPYRIAERVTITTWQYGLIAPSYPPKFFSQDFLVPGFTGTVLDIGLFYTRIQTDDEIELRLPNSIMIQAAILSHEVGSRPVRTKYEIPAASHLPPDRVLGALTEAVRSNDWVVDPASVSVLINQATASSYVVTIDARCRGSLEEPARSSILITAMHVVRNLSESGPSSPSGPGARAAQGGRAGPVG